MRADSPDEALYDMAANPRACRRRVIPPIGDDSRDWGEQFFADCVDSPHTLRDCLLVLDEITLWSRYRATTTLEKLILQGRRFGLRMAVACQRIALTPDVMLAEMTELVLFRMTRPRDLETVEIWTDRETANACSRLDKGSALVISL